MNFLFQFTPYWIAGIFTGTLISSLLPLNRLKNINILKGLKGVFLGTFLGILSPAGLYGAIPLMAALSVKGIPKPFLFSFLISTPLINPNLFIYTAGILGLHMAIARAVCAVITGFIAGACVLILDKGNSGKILLADFNLFSKGYSEETDNTRVNFNIKFFLKEFLRFLNFSFKYFLFAIIISAWIEVLIPKQFITKLLGIENYFAVIFATILSVPLYVCGGNTIPMIKAIIEKGMSEGAALAFFIAGPATKISNMVILSTVLGMRGLIFFLFIVITLAIISGYLYNFIYTTSYF